MTDMAAGTTLAKTGGPASAPLGDGAAAVGSHAPGGYRRDIDGLRALAVLPVVAYHCRFPIVHGGYVGVDVFFVISGFLITGILARDIEAGRFSIADFYQRRIRRIFPALFFLLLVTTALATVLLYPLELVSYGRSLLANAVFVSNNYFLTSTGYFTNSGDSKPLIHTWSLAVEEQYYIVFPPLLWLLLRRHGRHRTALILIGLALASLIASALLLRGHPSTVFYLAPLRAWELLTGSVLALDVAPVAGPRLRQVLAGIGLAMIAVPMLLYSSATPFPGLSALPPCLGAALLIHAGRGGPTLVGRVLSLRPVVGVGLISYSLYLWHWPLIVFWRLGMNYSPGVAEKLGLFAAAILIATLSWAVIERPFRTRALLARRDRLFAAAAAAIILTAAGGAALVASGGAAWRFPQMAVRYASYLDYDVHASQRQGRCFITGEERSASAFDGAYCLAKRPGMRNMLLMGDSHAAHLYPGVVATFPAIHFLQANSSGCKPLLDEAGADRCVSLRDRIFREVIPRERPDAVLLSANWKPADIGSIAPTVRFLRRYTARVVVFGPIVEYRQPLPRLLAQTARGGAAGLIDANRLPGTAALDAAIGRAATAAGADYVSTFAAVCPNGRCITSVAPGVPVQFDYSHLTPAGSAMVARQWRDLQAFR